MAAYDRPVTPSTVARDRYQRCFASNIFDPPAEPKAQLAPAGKRRDQTVSEMFGDDQEGKNLKFQQGTFAPKDDPRSAREKKQDFLSSTVLPATSYEYGTEEHNEDDPHRAFSIDPVARRLQENTSLIFTDGQDAPAAGTDSEVHAKWAENKLRPTSFRWYQQLETAKDAQGEEDSAAVRALHEKRSTVLRNGAPDAVTSESAAVHARHEDEQRERAIEQVADGKRRANCYYSDLFGRETPMDFAQAPGARHAKRVAPEDRITVHGDWSDARTEIDRGVGPQGDRTPAARKLDEFHHDRVFGEGWDAEAVGNFKPEPILVHCQAPDVMDNSKKVERHAHDTKVIHQAHMQSSVVDKQFYRDAATRTAWEVAEVHVSGLAPSESNETIGQKMRAAGFHVIRVSAAMDPVNNTCKGTCRLQVRYNPDERQHPVETLLRVLEEKYGLRGEM